MAQRLLLSLTSLAFLPWGCSPGALPGTGGDGGAPADLTASSDLPALLSCTDAQRGVREWLQSHRACKVDADCTWHQTGCGLDDECGGYVNKSASGDARASLVDFFKRNCGPICKPCPPPEPPSPGCVAGVCAHKENQGAPVGDGCKSGADCATGECATFGGSKLWVGGYCTIIDCNIKDVKCPDGSTCKAVGDGRSYCLKNCNPALSKTQCRNNEGYACCWGGGPGAMVGWCASSASGLCQAD